MDKLQIKHYLIEASQLSGVGWHCVERIIQEALYYEKHLTQEQLLEMGFSKKISAALCQFHKEFHFRSMDELLDRENRLPYRIVSIWDELYPELLKQIAQPPWMLFCKGRLELLRTESVAIVGTRYPTSYGITCTKQFSKQFSDAGLTVVSGFANGIDTVAHREVLKQDGNTIAVLPSAITQCYPTNNFALFEQVSEDGLLISESAQRSAVHPGQFHQRNRIIAGLSRATIIIEGERKSGSMITARHALDMDRELFAVPGSIYSKKSDGPNFLIEKGYARMLLSSQQLFEELSWLKNNVNSCQGSSVEANNINQPDPDTLTDDERKIYSFLLEQPRSINEIYEHTSISFGHLNVLLLNLCIKQFIELQPGSVYIAL